MATSRIRPPLRRISGLLAALALAGCGVQAHADPGGRADRGAVGGLARARSATRHYEYVLVDDAMYVYDIDRGQRLVERLPLPHITRIRGVVADIRTRMLYISHGGDGAGNGDGWLAKYDLLSNRVVWDVHYSRGVDSPALSRDRSRLYLPDGELSADGIWSVIDARSGAVVGQIRAGDGPHNTIVGLSGRRVYLGGRNHPYLEVASTATDRVIKRVGPLFSGVRPFTINGAETLAYTTATGLLGFQISSLVTGRLLYTVGFGRRFRHDPATSGLTAPSHGISLSPNERELWVLDTPNAYVHVFALRGVPGHPPRSVADIRLSHSFSGSQSDCSQDCGRDGWLQHSLSGCFVYVGDAGDVLSTVTHRRVGYLPALRDSREMLEIDWRAGVPVATSTRTGLGYVTGRSRPGRSRCR